MVTELLSETPTSLSPSSAGFGSTLRTSSPLASSNWASATPAASL